jgi:hypothetical protein
VRPHSLAACGLVRRVWRHDARVVLTPCADVSPAGWIMTSERPWQQLVSFGPEGLPAYARLRFLPDPAYEGQRESDVHVDDDALTETERLRAVLETLTRHTHTPDDCYFCLWDGWADIEGGSGVRILDPRTAILRRGPRIAPAFPPSVLHGPKVVVPNARSFCSGGQCPTSATGAQLRCGRVNRDCICPTPRSSGRPTTLGASPTTLIRIGPGSEPTSRLSRTFWLIRVSTLFQPTHANSSPPTGRHVKPPDGGRRRSRRRT